MLLALLLPGAAPAAGEVYARLDTWGWSEPVSLKAYGDTWEDRLDRDGDDGSAFLWAETGVRLGRWSVSAVTQQLILADATRQTAALYHRVRNELPFVPGERFEVDLDAFLVRAQGLRLAHVFAPWSGWEAELGLSLLDGFDLVDGTLRGQAEAVSENDYSYRARLAYTYDDDAIFDRPVRGEHGFGAALDLRLRGLIARQWTVDLRVHNLPGRMWWDDAPRTVGTLNSATRQQDDNGNVVFRPALSGRETFRDFEQRLPAVGTLALGWESGGWLVPGLRARVNPVHTLSSVYAALPMPGAGRLEVERLLQPGAWGLAWYGRYGELRLTSDRRRLEDAHVLAITVALSVPW